LNTALIVLTGALIGSRFGYALVNWGYFQTHPAEVFQVWLGGLTGPGAFWGGALTCLGYCWLRGYPLGDLLDGLLPLVWMLALSIWLACWQAGVAYGAPEPGFWAVLAPDEWGEVARRWPVQFTGAALTLLSAGLIDLCQPLYRYPGQKAALGLALLAAQQAALTFLRADPAPIWQGLRIDTWAWSAACLVGLTILLIGRVSARGVLRPANLPHN
jgi:prolipoprotein diacylglyceryltransferase